MVRLKIYVHLIFFVYIKDATVKENVFSGRREVLVSPGLVRKDGLDLDKCAKACIAEKSINCQYFKFINSTKTCYLSESDHPTVQSSESANSSKSSKAPTGKLVQE